MPNYRLQFGGLSPVGANPAVANSFIGVLADHGFFAIRSVGSPAFVGPAIYHPKSTKVPKKLKLVQGFLIPILATDHHDHGVSSPVQS